MCRPNVSKCGCIAQKHVDSCRIQSEPEQLGLPGARDNNNKLKGGTRRRPNKGLSVFVEIFFILEKLRRRHVICTHRLAGGSDKEA